MDADGMKSRLHDSSDELKKELILTMIDKGRNSLAKKAVECSYCIPTSLSLLVSFSLSLVTQA